MTAEVGPDSSSQPALAPPAEPIELQALLRAGVGESPVAGRSVALTNVTELFWNAWSGELSALGVDQEKFTSIVSGATMEVWLWVMGDRPFDQLAASLAGRTLRRAR